MLSNHFQILPGRAVTLKGELGKAAALCRENFLKRTNWKALVDVFRTRLETTSWRCEFWGKLIRGAILMAYTTGDQELTEILRETIYDMISTQDPNGCISTTAPENQPGTWDMWGRKYVLWGFLRYYQYLDRDPRVLEAACKLADHIMTQMGPAEGALPVTEVGSHNGMAACSILDIIVRLYRLTGCQKYLDYAKYLVKSGCYKGDDIFKAALEKRHPNQIANRKGYEMTSCFQGLGELCLETDDFPEALEVLTNYYEGVRDREILCTGVGGGGDCWGEKWNDMAFKQNLQHPDPEVDGAMGETCVTVTWLHYLERILQLTGDAKVFDQCELSFYNALLGSMTIDGTNFLHRNPTPLAGTGFAPDNPIPLYAGAWKIPTPDQMLVCYNEPFYGMDCCRVQGPEGLALAPILGVMATSDTNAIVFHLYEDMEVNHQGVQYLVSGGWPFSEKAVTITLKMDAPKAFPILFRVPEREPGKAFLDVNGQSYDAAPGTYLTVEREWKDGDVVTVHFDYTLRKRDLPTTPASFCYMKGAVVLAEDARLNRNHRVTTCYRMAFPNNAEGTRYLCDYASAGGEFLEVYGFRVVFPKE